MKLVTFFLIFLGLSLEYIAVQDFFQRFNSPLDSQLLWWATDHTLASLVFAAGLSRVYDGRTQWRWFLTHLSFLLPLPVLGMAGSFMVYLTERFSRASATTEDYFEELEYNKKDLSRFQKLDNWEGFVQARLSVQPISDIIRGLDSRLKIQAVMRLADVPAPDSVRLLRDAMKDPDPDVRMHAASSLTQIEEAIVEGIVDTEDRLKEKPHEARLHVKHAQQCAEYCYLKLLEPEMEKHFLNRSVQSYETSFQLGYYDEDALLQVSKMYIGVGRGADALRCLEHILQDNPEHINARIWRCEASFRKGDFRQVRADCLHLKALDIPQKKVQEVVRLWASQKGEHTAMIKES